MSEPTKVTFLGQPLTARETLLARHAYMLAMDSRVLTPLDELFPLSCQHLYAVLRVDSLLTPSITCRDCGESLPQYVLHP